MFVSCFKQLALGRGKKKCIQPYGCVPKQKRPYPENEVVIGQWTAILLRQRKMDCDFITIEKNNK